MSRRLEVRPCGRRCIDVYKQEDCGNFSLSINETQCLEKESVKFFRKNGIIKRYSSVFLLRLLDKLIN